MRVSLLIFLFFAAARVFSQGGQVFSLEPAFGVNAAQIHGDGFSGYDKPGLFGGAAINIKHNDRLSYQFGIYVSQKGARHNANPKNMDYNTIVWRVDFIDLPLSIRYKLNAQYHGMIGVSAAYLYHEKYIVNRSIPPSVTVSNKFEGNVSFGLGRKIKDNLMLEVRCTNGFTPFQNYGIKSNIYYSNFIARNFTKGYYNNILTVFVAYTIEPKKRISE